MGFNPYLKHEIGVNVEYGPEKDLTKVFKLKQEKRTEFDPEIDEDIRLRTEPVTKPGADINMDPEIDHELEPGKNHEENHLGHEVALEIASKVEPKMKLKLGTEMEPTGFHSEARMERTDSELSPKNLLDGKLSAAGSWFTDDRWKKEKDPRNTVVGEPPPGRGDIAMEKEVVDLQKMIIDIKPQFKATVKELSSPVADSETIGDLETVKRESLTVVSGYEEASYKQELQPELEPKWKRKEVTTHISDSKDTDELSGKGKCTSLTINRVLESANLLTREGEEKMKMNHDPVETIFFKINTKLTKMANDDIEVSERVVSVEASQDIDIETEDIFIRSRRQLTHVNSNETKTAIDLNKIDVKEQEEYDPKIIEEEDILTPTENIEELHRFDNKEIKGKVDESKPIHAIETQNKQGAVYDIDTPNPLDIDSNEEEKKAITRLTNEDSKDSQDLERHEDTRVEAVDSIEDYMRKKTNHKDNQIEMPEQPMVPKTEEEDQEEDRYVNEDTKAENTELVKHEDVENKQSDNLRSRMTSRNTTYGKTEVPKSTYPLRLARGYESNTLSAGEEADDTTSLERTTAKEPKSNLKKKGEAQDEDDPKLRLKHKQNEEEKNLFQSEDQIVRRVIDNTKNEATKTKETGIHIPSTMSRKKEALEQFILGLLILNRHQMEATMVKEMITNSKHPSSTSVSLDSIENNSGAFVETFPSRDEEIEVPSILRRSVAFMESKFLLDPGGNHTSDDKDWNNKCGLPDEFDREKGLDDVPLPRSKENVDGVVSKLPKTAVRTNAVQLNLGKNMDTGEIYQILPSVITHVYGDEDTQHVTQTAVDTSTEMQTNTRQKMKNYITEKIYPNNMKMVMEPEKRY